MKKIFGLKKSATVVLTAIMAAGLVACGEGAGTQTSTSQTTVEAPAVGAG